MCLHSSHGHSLWDEVEVAPYVFDSQTNDQTMTPMVSIRDNSVYPSELFYGGNKFGILKCCVVFKKSWSNPQQVWMVWSLLYLYPFYFVFPFLSTSFDSLHA
jgi:hypothetical protein